MVNHTRFAMAALVAVLGGLTSLVHGVADPDGGR